jgi:hypothetical protein
LSNNYSLLTEQDNKMTARQYEVKIVTNFHHYFFWNEVKPALSRSALIHFVPGRGIVESRLVELERGSLTMRKGNLICL